MDCNLESHLQPHHLTYATLMTLYVFQGVVEWCVAISYFHVCNNDEKIKNRKKHIFDLTYKQIKLSSHSRILGRQQ